MMNSKIRQGILICLLMLLLLFGPILAIYSIINPNFNMIELLSAGSTYAVALLTVAYVLTTSKQLDVMANQLEEAKRDRELQNQPLPLIYEVKMLLEKPDFYYTPPSHPKDPYSAKSRYIVEFNLKNIGNFPALCVDISAQIIVPKNNDVIRLNASASLRIDALEPSQIIKYDVTSEEGLLFSGDDDYSVLNALIETELEKYPQLLLKVYYRNLLGGCFIVSNVYALYPEEDNDPVLKNWITQISSFSIQYKNELNTLKRIEGTNQEQWTELFDKLNEILKKSLTDKEIMLNPEPKLPEEWAQSFGASMIFRYYFSYRL